MIVRPVNDRFLLITQPEHAHLSRRVMEGCAALHEHSRQASILHAIGEHDNGWAEEDATPLIDPESGRVADFVTSPASVRQRVWPRGIARLEGDPWAAALVAHHAVTVYDRYRPDPEWTSFFSRMETSRDALVRARGLSLEELVPDYAFVRLGDLISLMFCTGWSEAQRFGPWSVSRAGSRVLVTPDAFAGAAIPMVIEAREIGPGPFRSDAELRAALAAARRVIMHGEVTGS